MFIVGKEYKDKVQRLFRNCYEFHGFVFLSGISHGISNWGAGGENPNPIKTTS
jgi:hypothetical protein